MRLWNAATGETVRTLRGHTSYVTSVSFAPDGRTLASDSAEQDVHLWNVASGERLRTFHGHTKAVGVGCTSRRNGSCSARLPRMVGAAVEHQRQGNLLRTLLGHEDAESLHSRSRRTPAPSLPGPAITLRLWDAASGEPRLTLHGHSGAVVSVTFSPDGRTLASSSEDGSVRLWDGTVGRCRRRPVDVSLVLRRARRHARPDGNRACRERR